MEFKFKWKNLTRSDVIQYDGEKFVNVPVYTLRLQENQKGEGGNSYGDSSMVRWGLIADEYATLTVSGKSQKLALNEHKHSILDIENLESILNSKMDIGGFNNHFIRKDINDYADGFITFKSGLKSSDVAVLEKGFVTNSHGVDQSGNAILNNITIHAGLQSPKFTPGWLGEGFNLWIDDNGQTHLTIDNLMVRKNMDIFQLTINKIQHVGGAFLFSPAAITIGRVEELQDVYRCYIEEAVSAENQPYKNLLLNSDKIFLDSSSNVTLSNTSNSGKILINNSSSASASRSNIHNLCSKNYLTDTGKEYTLSVDIKASFSNINSEWEFKFDIDGNSNSAIFGDSAGEWVRLYSSIIIPSGASNSSIIFTGTGTSGDSIEYRNFKIENNGEGSYWSVSPEQNFPSINNFIIDDQAICQTFSNNSTKRYWRLVTNVAEDRSYIDLSKDDKEDNSAIPEVGDVVVQLGHRSDLNRQNAVLISSYGNEGPYQQFLKGVDSYDLTDKIKIQLGKKTFFHDVDSFSIKSNDVSYKVPVDKGIWDENETYYANDRVSHKGVWWIALDTTTDEPSDVSINWKRQSDDVETDVDLTSVWSQINLNKDNIELKAGKDEVNVLEGRIISAESAIIVNSDNIALKASQSEVNSLTGRISSAESAILLNAGNIELKVSKDGVVGAINLSPEGVAINAARLDINGIFYQSKDYLKVGSKNLLREYDIRFNFKYWGGVGNYSLVDYHTISGGVNTGVQNDKAFIVQNKDQYLQPINLQPGKYTFSTWILNKGSQGLASIGFQKSDNTWTNFDFSDQVIDGQWKFVDFTFELEHSAKAFSLYNNTLVSQGQTLILYPTLTDGMFALDPQANELDLTEDISIGGTTIQLGVSGFTFSATPDGRAKDKSIDIPIYVMKLGEMENVSSSSYVVPTGSEVPAGMSFTKHNNYFTVTVNNNFVSESGALPVIITVGEIQYTRYFTYSLSKDGGTGTNAPLIDLSGSTQIISVDENGVTIPSTDIIVQATTLHTAITSWEYSVDGGSFSTTLPTGVTRSSNTVTINPITSIFKVLTIKASDETISDEFTIARTNDGSGAYTVLLTNENHTFAGSVSNAIAGSTTTNIITYKGNNSINPTNVVVGTLPTGMTATVSGDKKTITFNVTTSLTSPNGSIPITITVDGKTFTRNFSYSISFKGETGVSATWIEITGDQILKNPISTDSVTLTVTKYNFTDGIRWQYKDTSDTWVNLGTANTQIIQSNAAYFTDTLSIKCFRVSDPTIFDTYTIAKVFDGQQGESAYTIILGNETVSVPFQSGGTNPIPPLISVRTTIKAWKGSQQLPVTVQALSGITINNNNTNDLYINLSNWGSLPNNPTMTFTLNLTVDGKSFSKLWNVVKVTDGDKGENAKYIELTGNTVLKNPNKVDGIKSTIITATLFGIEGNVNWEYRNNTNTGWLPTPWYTNDLLIDYSTQSSIFYNNILILKCRSLMDPTVYNIISITVVTDGEKGDDGENAVSITLSNYFMGFKTNANGSAIAKSFYIDIYAIKGSQRLDVLASQITYSFVPYGMTVTKATNRLHFSVNTSFYPSAEGLDITITIDGKQYLSTFSWNATEKGDPGTPGTSSYTHIRYSQNSNGSSMTTSSTGAKYIGFANTTSSTAPSNYTSYSWSKMQGDQGDPGAPARYITLVATTNIIKIDKAGVRTPSGSVFVTATKTNLEGSITWNYSINGGNTWTSSVSGISASGDVVTISNGFNLESVVVRATINSGGVTYTDTETVSIVRDGQDGSLDDLPSKMPVVAKWRPNRKYFNNDNIVHYVQDDTDPNAVKWYMLKPDLPVTNGANLISGDPPLQSIALSWPNPNTSPFQEISSVPIMAMDTIIANEGNIAEFIFKEGKLISQKGSNTAGDIINPGEYYKFEFVIHNNLTTQPPSYASWSSTPPTGSANYMWMRKKLSTAGNWSSAYRITGSNPMWKVQFSTSKTGIFYDLPWVSGRNWVKINELTTGSFDKIYAITESLAINDYTTNIILDGNSGLLESINSNIRGTINATSGKIGGWTITPEYLYSDQTGLVGNAIDEKVVIYAGSTYENRESAPFKVDNKGVLTAKFRQLTAADDTSNNAYINFVTSIEEGGITFGGGNLSHQGPGFIFRTNNVYNRGAFGARTRIMLKSSGNSYGYLYNLGRSGSSTHYVNFSGTGTVADPYVIPLYGNTGTGAGAPVDIVLLPTGTSTTYNYALPYSPGKVLTLVNPNDSYSKFVVFNGRRIEIYGGTAITAVCLDTSDMVPSIGNVAGKGWFISGYFDNNWP